MTLIDLTGIGPMTSVATTRAPRPPLERRLARRRSVWRRSWRRDMPWVSAVVFIVAAAMLWQHGYVGLIDVEAPLLAGVAALGLRQQVHFLRSGDAPQS